MPDDQGTFLSLFSGIGGLDLALDMGMRNAALERLRLDVEENPDPAPGSVLADQRLLLDTITSLQAENEELRKALEGLLSDAPGSIGYRAAETRARNLLSIRSRGVSTFCSHGVHLGDANPNRPCPECSAP